MNEQPSVAFCSYNVGSHIYAINNQASLRKYVVAIQAAAAILPLVSIARNPMPLHIH